MVKQKEYTRWQKEVLDEVRMIAKALKIIAVHVETVGFK